MALLQVLGVFSYREGVWFGAEDAGSERAASQLDPQKTSQPDSVHPPAPSGSSVYPRRQLTGPSRGLAITAAKRMGTAPEEVDDEIWQLIDQALRAQDKDDREFALSELSLRDLSPEIAWACLEALKDPSSEVREEAVLALEMLEVVEAIPVLQSLQMDDPSEEVRDAAQQAVEFLQQEATRS